VRVGVNYIATNPKIPLNVFHKQKGSLHLLLHPDKPHWLVVNDLGWEIIKLCNGRHDVDDIVSFIAIRYNRNPDTVYRDVDTYVAHLCRAHFLSTDSGSEKLERPASSLKRLHLNITERCNLRCIHCGVVANPPKKECIKKNKVFEIIDELSEI
jgi:hypothetical protein